MPYCTRCGREIKEGERCICQRQLPNFEVDTSSFSAFCHSLGQRMGIGDPSSTPGDRYERSKQIVPDNVAPCNGEVPVRQYDLCVLRSRIKFMRAEGRLQVTNKRVLFRARGTSLTGSTTLQHEFYIDELAGFQISRNFRFSILDLLVGLVLSSPMTALGMSLGGSAAYSQNAAGLLLFLCFALGIAALAPTFLLHKKFLIKTLCCSFSLGLLLSPVATVRAKVAVEGGPLWGLLNLVVMLAMALAVIMYVSQLMLFSFKPNLDFNVETKSGHDVIHIRCERTGFGFMRNSFINAVFTGYNEVLPTEQTERAIAEVGAMISDIQKLGDFGIEKWKEA